MADIKNLIINFDNILKKSKKIMIFPHAGADFDAIGSSLGISLIANKMRKPNEILLGDSTGSINHGVKLIKDEASSEHKIITLDEYKAESHDEDLNILCDHNKPQQMHKEIHPESLPLDRTIIIDHHEKDKETFQGVLLEYIDPTTSSASEIVARMLFEYGIKIPVEIANYLLAGIRLDTNGDYSYETSEMVTELLKLGATADGAKYYFIENFKSDCRVRDLVNRAKFTKKRDVGVVIAPESRKYSSDELAKAADQVLKYANVSYVVGRVGKEVRISARSRGMINIGKTMEQIGGGGREKAGGACFADISVKQVGSKIRKILLPQHCILK